MWSEFKQWFAESGIKYNLVPFDHPLLVLNGTEMVDTINPFTQVIENPEHPMAKIYREGAWQALIDTYEILMGNHYDLSIEGKGRKGLLDILILPVISRRIIYHWVDISGQHNQDHVFIRLLKACIVFPFVIPAGIVEAGRVILASVLTLLAAPFVFGVHWATANKKQKLEEQLKKLPIVEVRTLANGSTEEIVNTLNDWMLKTRVSSANEIAYEPEQNLYVNKYYSPFNTKFRPLPVSFKTHSGKSEKELAHDAFCQLNVGQKVRIR